MRVRGHVLQGGLSRPGVFGALVAFVSLTVSSANADRGAEIEKMLRDFHSNPKKAMNAPLFRGQRPGSKIPGFFSAEDIRTKNFVTKKRRFRDETLLKGKAGPGRAPIAGNDQVEELVDNGSRALNNIEEMEARRLTRAKLAESPWSDDYWPIYRGVLASRYADSNFPASKDWKKNSDYILHSKASLDQMFAAADLSSSVDTLSPAEKYDLLVGDSNETLTRAMLEEGQGYYASNNSVVETWMGICHGWAPAAYMLPRPTQAIQVLAADGVTKITFYPSDIKALGSLLWAKAAPDARFIGGRCNDKAPKADANGRIQDQDCFDNNPGAWHQAVVNQIGVAQRSFVIDATYDYEVWNQPVYSYSYSYFNPLTRKETASLADAKVPLSALKDDKFARYRSPQARYVVGIAMDIAYVVETEPTTSLKDDASRDALNSARYLYDLELDSNGRIIGGEWYTNKHPDFLWTPAPGARAVSIGDSYLKGKWDGRAPIPSAWSRVAARASEQGQPLAAVVETLVTMSRLAK